MSDLKDYIKKRRRNDPVFDREYRTFSFKTILLWWKWKAWEWKMKMLANKEASDED